MKKQDDCLVRSIDREFFEGRTAAMAAKRKETQMRKFHLAAAGAIAVLMAAAGCTTPAGSTPAAPPPSGATHPVEVLNYLDIRTGTEFLDLGRRGGEPSPGDAYFFRSALRRIDQGDDVVARLTVGSFLSTCVFISGMQAKCSGVLRLSSGTIDIAGTTDFSSAAPITAAVVGGTGSYNAVVGRVTITPTDQAKVSTLVVSLERRGW
jgi:hypothetical protein